jgi:hypothetical protein
MLHRKMSNIYNENNRTQIHAVDTMQSFILLERVHTVITGMQPVIELLHNLKI